MEKETKMTKEDYLRKKGILAPIPLGIMYMFSSSREGVGEIRQVGYYEVIEGGYRQSGSGKDTIKELGMNYKMKDYPTLTLYGEEVVGQEDGYGSGFGDLWGNSQFWSLDESALIEARDKEQERIVKKYLSRIEGTIMFNLNQDIYVKLTEEGYQHRVNLYNDIIKYSGDESKFHTVDYYKNEANEYGYTKFMAWEFMKDFGDTISFGGRQLFDINIQIKNEQER